MKYHVVLVKKDEGFSVSCPALPGCHSQGSAREEALSAIRDMISRWIEAAGKDELRA